MSKRRTYITEKGFRRNSAGIYILPMLDYTREFFPEELIETYIVNNGEKSKIICVFENIDSEDLRSALTLMKTHQCFEDLSFSNDVSDEIIVTFGVPKERLTDFEKFITGKFTKFSTDYKETLLDFHGRRSGNGKCLMMVDVLYPDHLAKKFRADKMSTFMPGSNPVSINDLPGGEVESIPDLEQETYIAIDILTEEKQREIQEDGF